MKQTTFIVLGALVILVLIGAWVYVLISGSPKEGGQFFTDLGLGGEEDTGIVIAPEPVAPEEPVVNMDRPRLRQLTTKPVIGFTEVQATTSDPVVVYYAEAGTGHVYTIRLDSGEETRISNTTVDGGEASMASFSPGGDAVAIRSHNDKRSGKLTVGNFDRAAGSLKLIPFETAVSDFTLVSSSSLLYTSRTEAGIVATEHNLTTGTESTVFTVPFYEALIQWGTSSRSIHNVYTKPSYLLEGYLYSFTRGTPARFPVSGFGFSALGSPLYTVYSTTTDFTPRSFSYASETGERTPLSIITLPEKCVFSTKQVGLLWCGYELKKPAFEFPDSWYRGEESFKDSLWLVDLTAGGAAELLVDTFSASGREIDIASMRIGGSETALYFINKNDNTLWMYEL